ncbi:MAG: hypothetical protein AAGI52_10625 [Bacteroidota bacterium]
MNPAERPRDWPLLLAMLFNLLLCIPAMVGVAVLGSLSLSLLFSPADLGQFAFVFALYGGPALYFAYGIRLAFGYWQLIDRGMDEAAARAFWWRSLVYNGVGFAACCVLAFTSPVDASVLAIVAWIVFMLALSARRLQFPAPLAARPEAI